MRVALTFTIPHHDRPLALSRIGQALRAGLTRPEATRWRRGSMQPDIGAQSEGDDPINRTQRTS